MGTLDTCLSFSNYRNTCHMKSCTIQGGHHRKPWFPTRGIPSYPGRHAGGIPGGPAGGIPGGPAEGISSQPGGSAGGIPAPSALTRGAQGDGGGKKWCIGNQNIKKGLLKAAFEELCKEVDCSPTGPQGLCYDESIWSKASYAMNLRYQKNGQKDSDCNLEGRAQIVTTDPSTSSTSFLCLLYLLFNFYTIRITNFLFFFFQVGENVY